MVEAKCEICGKDPQGNRYVVNGTHHRCCKGCEPKPEIDEMPAGREMDALVAEKVMGLTILRADGYEARGLDLKKFPDGWDYKFKDGVVLPAYSTDIAAAFEVVQQIISTKNCGCDLSCTNHYPDIYGAMVMFPGILRGPVFGDTFAEAICRAALKVSL